MCFNIRMGGQGFMRSYERSAAGTCRGLAAKCRHSWSGQAAWVAPTDRHPRGRHHSLKWGQTQGIIPAKPHVSLSSGNPRKCSVPKAGHGSSVPVSHGVLSSVKIITIKYFTKWMFTGTPGSRDTHSGAHPPSPFPRALWNLQRAPGNLTPG